MSGARGEVVMYPERIFENENTTHIIASPSAESQCFELSRVSRKISSDRPNGTGDA